jgi:hypothetical protein
VIGGLGNISAIRANACQAANGTGSNMGLMPAQLLGGGLNCAECRHI